MSCIATRRNLVLSFLIALVAATLVTRKVSAAPGEASTSRYSIELKPLPMLVLGVPGSSAVSGEAEVKMTHNLALFAGASHSDVHSQPSAGAADLVAAPLADDTITSGVDAGLRYYGNTLAESSWYVGGHVGGDSLHVDWTEQGDHLSDDRLAFLGGVDVGYRWTWNSGLLLRFGVGAEASSLAHRDLASVSSPAPSSPSEAVAQVESADPTPRLNVQTRVDVGVGFTF